MKLIEYLEGGNKFQSTPPARGATPKAVRASVTISISIHAPREGGDDIGGVQLIDVDISIHAPREGGDSTRLLMSGTPVDFNPRPPRGGRHDSDEPEEDEDEISIHAPREGGDVRLLHFFQFNRISIHAPREGGDR